MNSTSSSDSAAILADVATSEPPAAAEVIKALLVTEKALKKTPVDIPFATLVGTWQLRFTSGAKKTKRGLKLEKSYYWPSWLYAAISFEEIGTETIGRVQNQLRLGGIEIRFTGPCRAHNRHNILVFDFAASNFSRREGALQLIV